jgi:hypothetical protein
MKPALPFARRLARPLAPALALLALAAGVVSALHHHALDRSHDQCAVCSYGATPAVAAVAAATPGAPSFEITQLSPPAIATPPRRALGAALARAPPLA